MVSFDVAAGRRFGPYLALRRIGVGGMGTVFEAEDTGLGHRVAVKVLHPHLAERPGAAQRFMREGRAAARIQHRHVVRVLTLGAEDRTPYLAMELLEGENLSELLARKGRLSVDDALALTVPVIAAVLAAHKAGVIHRDLKPSNICITTGPEGQPWPKVVDFGVSKVLSDDPGACPTITEAMVGTLAYMAPEQARSSHDASCRSDVYSLGVLLYQAVTGSLPFSGRSAYEVLESIMTLPVAPPSARVPGIPDWLDAALARAMSRDPEQRFATAGEFGAALLPYVATRPRLAYEGELTEGVLPPAPPRLREDESLPLVSSTYVSSTYVGDTNEAARAASPPSHVRELAPGWPASRAAVRISAHDGVGVAMRRNVITSLWNAPTRLHRSRWFYDRLEEAVAEHPEGIGMLMILLPSAELPDSGARAENTRRLRHLARYIHRCSVVITGNSVRQYLVRGIMRTINLPFLRPPNVPDRLRLAGALEQGVASLIDTRGLSLPPAGEVLADALALYALFGLPAPDSHDEAVALGAS